jgi:hypothetical protein
MALSTSLAEDQKDGLAFLASVGTSGTEGQTIHGKGHGKNKKRKL